LVRRDANETANGMTLFFVETRGFMNGSIITNFLWEKTANERSGKLRICPNGWLLRCRNYITFRAAHRLNLLARNNSLLSPSVEGSYTPTGCLVALVDLLSSEDRCNCTLQLGWKEGG